MMKKLLLSILLLGMCAILACNNNGKLSVSQDAIDKLEQIKHDDKFTKEHRSVLTSPKLNDTIVVLINRSVDDFIATAKNNPTEAKFQTTMRKALAHFSKTYSELDASDKGIIAGYFQEMMNIVGTDDKEGILHKWQYGMINADDENN